MAHKLEVLPLGGVAEIAEGTDLAAEIVRAARDTVATIGSGDVLVVAQKVVSKAEGRLRPLAGITPSQQAHELARATHKDARLVQAILDESQQVLRSAPGVLITRTHHGLVCANAGVDQSNIPAGDTLCLLPVDPDDSARRLRDTIGELLGHRPAVVISDSFGRAWRIGQADTAIGCAGLEPLDDQRGRVDAQSRELTATIVAVADEAASAASLVRGKATGEAIVLVRGLERFVTTQDGPGAAAIVRPVSEDLFG